MAKAISQQELLQLTNAFATVKEAVLKPGRQVTEDEQYWLRHCSDTLRIAKHQCEYMPISFGGPAHAPNYFRRLTVLLFFFGVHPRQEDDILGEIGAPVCTTRKEAPQRTHERRRQRDGDQRVETRGEPVRHHRTEWHEHYPDRSVRNSLGMSDHDSDSAKMYSDDESTRLHIHDCDVRDDA